MSQQDSGAENQDAGDGRHARPLGALGMDSRAGDPGSGGDGSGRSAEHVIGTFPLLSGPDEARAFGRMRRRILATLVQQTFADAWFRLALIAVLSGLLWAGLFWLFAITTWLPKPWALTCFEQSF